MLGRYFFFILTITLLTVFSNCIAAEQRADQSICSDAELEIVGKHFGLKYFVYPPDGAYPSEENNGLIAAGVCRSWPTNKAQTISSFVYGANNDGTQKLLLALIDMRRRKVIASFKRKIEQDATTEFSNDSLRLDLAKYQLTKDIRAFALRENSFRDRCTYEGGSGDYLTLFLIERDSIRPVFNHTMFEQSYGPGDRCNGTDEIAVSETIWTISVGKSVSNGFADLKLSPRQDGKPASSGHLVQYNGCIYVNAPWEKYLCEK